MNINLLKSIDKAIEMAQKNSIHPAEVWVGPIGFQDIQDSLNVDPDVSIMDERLYLRGMRVRKMADEGVRVGITTCEFGPGVT